MPKHVQVRGSWWGLTKQECVVADATGTIQIVLFGRKKIGCLQEDRQRVADVHVKEFQGKKVEVAQNQIRYCLELTLHTQLEYSAFLR